MIVLFVEGGKMADSTWRVVFGLMFLFGGLAGAIVLGSQRATVRSTYAHLLTPAVEALAGNSVRIEDLAQIEQILEHRNSEFRDALKRRGITEEQIDNFRYGRYRLVQEE